MDKEKLKLIVRNLESLVECLKTELYSDSNVYEQTNKLKNHISDYDEIFEEDPN
jgi:hypothetical protein